MAAPQRVAKWHGERKENRRGCFRVVFGGGPIFTCTVSFFPPNYRSFVTQFGSSTMVFLAFLAFLAFLVFLLFQVLLAFLVFLVFLDISGISGISGFSGTGWENFLGWG